MASEEAPSWADQWGAGGIGAMDEEDKKMPKKESTNDNKNKKGGAGFAKVKAVAAVGALKLKNGTSAGVKWIKTKCNKK